MTRVAIGAAVCAVGLVAAAGVVAIATNDTPPTTLLGSTESSTSSVTTSSPSPTAPPTLTTATPEPRGPLTVEDAAMALPAPDGTYVAAELPVELAAVCDGARFTMVNSTPAYASLQTAESPLRYLDALVAVYETVPSASASYGRLDTAVSQCPPMRTATPTPTTATEAPVVVNVVGERRETRLGALPAVQWVQVQSGSGTELRTVVTVVAYENSLVAVSMDADSETVTADQLAAACLSATIATVDRLVSLVNN